MVVLTELLEGPVSAVGNVGLEAVCALVDDSRIKCPIRINTVPMIEISVIFSCKINTESITVIIGDT